MNRWKLKYVVQFIDQGGFIESTEVYEMFFDSYESALQYKESQDLYGWITEVK